MAGETDSRLKPPEARLTPWTQALRLAAGYFLSPAAGSLLPTRSDPGNEGSILLIPFIFLVLVVLLLLLPFVPLKVLLIVLLIVFLIVLLLLLFLRRIKHGVRLDTVGEGTLEERAG